ncbi:MAG TPA: AAA domain-containing protein, partial [Blastococcus sp.]
AILQFAKFRLWKDLDEHWADFAENPLVSHLVHEPTEAFTDPARDAGGFVDLDDLAAQLPVPADASQLRAIAEAGAGRTFVLEGPPGTGKSQTITNLLTRAVADGKRVLFVAEKRAALDVVARRLDAVGMGMFALDLHDKGSRASMVRAQIRLALEHTVAVDEQGLAADEETLRSARRMLARYADRLHDDNAVGLSLYSARTAELTAGTDVEPLPVPEPFVANAPADVLRAVRVELALLPDIADLTRPSLRHPWAFVDSPDIDLPATQAAAAAVDAAVRAASAIPELSGVLRRARTTDELDALAHVLSGPGDGSTVGLDVIDETFTELWTAATSAVLGEIAAFTAFRHPGLDVCTPQALGLPLAEIYVAAQTAAASSWWGRRRRLIGVRDQLAPYLRPEAKVKPAEVPALVENLWRVQTAVQAIAVRADSIPGLTVPAGWNPFVDVDLLDTQVQWLRRAGAAVDGSSAFHVALRKLIVAGLPAGPAAHDAVARLRDGVIALLDVCRSSPGQLATWAGDDGFVLRWSMTRPERGSMTPHESSGAGPVLMSLRRWITFLDTLEPLRYAGLFDARRLLVTGAVRADDAVRAFDRGLAASSVMERLDATGLDMFDAQAHEKAIRRFTTASRAVREHLTVALPARVLGSRPFDAASGSGQVGALQRELAKQRRGLGVRQLLAQYGELITSVMPCVLVSPDSVARFFPAAAGQFDLVVFDEASQIRVADAVGALGRARAAVVVGDSKQMPPTSFAEPSSGGEESTDFPETTVEDEESILSECVQARVPRQWLSWHYRSQDESLIAFSNNQYYENRLSSFPAPTHGRAS